MSEIIEGCAQELPKLTVAQFIKDMSSFPQDAPILACLTGIGMTIPVVGAYLMNTTEAGELVVLQIDQGGAIAALEHNMRHNEVMEQAKIDDGFKN